ncbi:MAG: DUF72 domain-containing protein [Candidatus Sulfotelmatobacter sp.]
MNCDIRIGTSGFHYKHWKGAFYPPKIPDSKLLDYYLQHFDTVELNNSFYRLPTAQTFDSWRNSTPPDFIFAVKASRFITHNKKLKDPENELNNLLPRAVHLGRKLGPILFQLPPHWRTNPARLAGLLKALPRELRYAFEFRELSWLNPEVDTILRKFNAAFCIYELAGYHAPLRLTADYAYIRLHGPDAGKYQGSYGDESLLKWARQIGEWSADLKAVYVYFDNDECGYAAANALTLKKMVAASHEKSPKHAKQQSHPRRARVA